MIDKDTVRDEIAFIRRAIAEDRGYAGARSPDMLVWGLAIAAGYLASYATVRGWWRLPQGWIWTACIVPSWIYSLRGTLGPRVRPERPRPATVEAIRICLTSLAIGLVATTEIDRGWFGAVTAGILAVAFFGVSSMRSRVDALGRGRLVSRPTRSACAATPAGTSADLGCPDAALLALPGATLPRRRTTNA